MLPVLLTCNDNGGQRDHPWSPTAGSKPAQNYLPICLTDSASRIISLPFFHSTSHGIQGNDCISLGIFQLTRTRACFQHKMCCKPPVESEDYRDYHTIFCTMRHLSVYLSGGISGSQEVIGNSLPLVALQNTLLWNSSSSTRSSVGYRNAMLSSHESPTPEMYRRMLTGCLQNASDYNVLKPRPRTITYQEVLQSAIAQMFYWWLHACCNSSHYLLALAVAMFSHRRNHHLIPPCLNLEIETLKATWEASPSDY